MKFLGVIPARFGSSRFPGKPLVEIAGKTMIERVYQQALKSKNLSSVIVATDDIRIYNEVISFNGNAIMTSNKHQSGTDRCAEVAENVQGFDVIINIQGDEPLISPNQIDLVCQCFLNANNQIATLIKKIAKEDELFNSSIPKVVCTTDLYALYFSRQTIPFIREKIEKDWFKNEVFYKHIGIYGYEIKTLKNISKLKNSLLENLEMLEQLRWIENGYKIKLAITEEESIAVDHPNDVQNILKILT